MPDLQNGSALPDSRRLLELAAIKAYEADLITGRQVQQMSGFDCREDYTPFSKRTTCATATRLKTWKGIAQRSANCCDGTTDDHRLQYRAASLSGQNRKSLHSGKPLSPIVAHATVTTLLKAQAGSEGQPEDLIAFRLLWQFVDAL